MSGTVLNASAASHLILQQPVRVSTRILPPPKETRLQQCETTCSRLHSEVVATKGPRPGLLAFGAFVLESWTLHFFLSLFFFFWPRHVACGILVPRPGIEPMPPAVKAPSPVLTTGPPGKSLRLCISFRNVHQVRPLGRR